MTSEGGRHDRDTAGLWDRGGGHWPLLAWVGFLELCLLRWDPGGLRSRAGLAEEGASWRSQGAPWKMGFVMSRLGTDT